MNDEARRKLLWQKIEAGRARNAGRTAENAVTAQNDAPAAKASHTFATLAGGMAMGLVAGLLITGRKASPGYRILSAVLSDIGLTWLRNTWNTKGTDKPSGQE